MYPEVIGNHCEVIKLGSCCLFSYFFPFLHVCVCVYGCVCVHYMCIHVSTKVWEESRRECWIPWNWSCRHYELPDLGAGNWTLSSSRTAGMLNVWTTFLAPVPYLFLTDLLRFCLTIAYSCPFPFNRFHLKAFYVFNMVTVASLILVSALFPNVVSWLEKQNGVLLLPRRNYVTFYK